MSGPTIDITVFAEEGHEVELALPAKFEVCPRCRGAGSHVNPAIDGNGISPDQFRDDPDFEEAYFRGDYDVACDRCKGKRVIAVPDMTKLTEAEKVIWRQHVQDEADYRAEVEAERRVGA